MAQQPDATGVAGRETVPPTGDLDVAVLAVSSVYRFGPSESYFWVSDQSRGAVPPLEPENKDHAVLGEEQKDSPRNRSDPKATSKPQLRKWHSGEKI